MVILPGYEIPATGHQTSLHHKADPTCTKTGYTGNLMCDLCGKMIEEGEDIPALRHQTVTYGQKAATCTEKGFSGTVKCQRCEEVLDSGHEVSPLNHSTTEIGNYKAATVLAAGYSGDTYCKLCGKLLKTGKELSRIVSNDAPEGKTDWQYTINARYPLIYHDETLNIKIDKVWYKKAWCCVAQVQMTDYARFYTYCANGKYGSTSSTTKAAKQNNAILATNGCYSAPSVGNQTARQGVVYLGGDHPCGSPVYYSSLTGLMGSSAMLGANKITLNQAVEQKLITDTFCFGPAFNMNGPNNDGGSAQRTTIGTNGNPGEFVLVVSEGIPKYGKTSDIICPATGPAVCPPWWLSPVGS